MVIDSRQITIEPLSPVFVWSGETLFSDLDFIVDGNDVIIVDFDKVIGEIKTEGDLEQYKNLLRELLKQYKQSGQYKNLLRELYGFKLEFKIVGGKTINQILDMNPYIIPASEVKGLIRTAVINELVKSNRNAFDGSMKRVLTELNKIEKNRKMSKHNLKNIGQIVEQVMKGKLPTRTKYVYDALKTLIISDPIVQSAEFNLNEIRILSIKGEPLTSTYAITFTKGKLTYDAKIVKPTDYGVYKNSEVESLNAKITWDLIVSSLKNFSKTVVADEISKINKYLSNKHSYKEDLNKYLELMKNIENTKDCIPLRIGMFTGHVAKTVEVRDDVKRKREGLLTRLYDKRWDNNTLKITGGVGLGWIKMCIK